MPTLRDASSAKPANLVIPLDLPSCDYPCAEDVAGHGLQPLPDTLPFMQFDAARPYRSRSYRTVPAASLELHKVLEMARVVARSFAQREPQCRHLRLPKDPPAALIGAHHCDAFGTDPFGPWSVENVMYWFIRLLVLTEPASPHTSIRLNAAALEQSLAIVDPTGRIIGGAFNETMQPPSPAHEFRTGDPFLAAVLSLAEPILAMLAAQDAQGIAALSARYGDFRAALEHNRVGHHFMVARSESLPKSDAFELVAGTAERYRELGFAFMLLEATNQWTGAACEVLGGVRVHFEPFRLVRRVAESPHPLAGLVSSPDGYLAAKDSGSMFYVIRIQA